MYFKRFDDAEDLYRQMDRSGLAIALRSRLGRLQILASIGQPLMVGHRLYDVREVASCCTIVQHADGAELPGGADGYPVRQVYGVLHTINDNTLFWS